MSNATGLKIIFAGTPDFAATHLQALLRSNHNVVAVYTQPDRPAGRGKKLTPGPVKQLATRANLEVFQPLSLKSDEQTDLLKSHNADLMVVVAYGLLLPKSVLEVPQFGCINVHASLLPRWRGAAPIQRAIEHGDDQTGITIMQMDEGLDTGHMLHTTACQIAPEDTATDLHDRLASIGPNALLATLEAVQQQTITATAQDHSQATYAHKLKKAEALIDWNTQAPVIDRRVRAFNPFPVAYTLNNQQRIRILHSTPMAKRHSQVPGSVLDHADGILIACADDTCLRLNQIQLPGKKAMPSKDILNGFAHLFQIDTVLGAAPGSTDGC